MSGVFDFDSPAVEVFPAEGLPANAEDFEWWQRALVDRCEGQWALKGFVRGNLRRQELVRKLIAFYYEDLSWSGERNMLGGSTQIRLWERETRGQRLQEILALAGSQEELVEANRLCLLATPELLFMPMRDPAYLAANWEKFQRGELWWPFPDILNPYLTGTPAST